MTLSRNLPQSGKLRQLIDTRSVVGVTTNPSTFERALNKGRAYDGQIAELTARGTEIDTAIRTVVTDHVRAACDVLRLVGGLRRCRRAGVYRGRSATCAQHR